MKTLDAFFVPLVALLVGYAIDSHSEVLPSQYSPQVTTAKTQMISASEAWEHVRKGALLVDVRSPEEYASEHLDEAINIPHTEIDQNLSKFGANRDREIVLHCRSGHRAELAQERLIALGYKHVYNAGGYTDLLTAKNDSKRRIYSAS